MHADSDRPGALHCLRRGLRSLRANWQLVVALMVQLSLTAGLLLAGLFILLTGLGVSVVAWLRGLGPDWPRRLVDDLAMGLETGLPALLPLIWPLIAASVVWSLALGLYCYLQGGVMGILAEGEMAAGAGLPGWRSFRAFSLTGFDLQGRRLFWPYFWFNHLVAVVTLVWLTLVLGVVTAAVALASGASGVGTALGVAVGCVGLVPAALLLLAAVIWSMLATVEVARPDAGVWIASRRALIAMWRRPGPVLAVCLAILVGSLLVGAAVAPLEWAVAFAAGDRMSLWLGGRGALLLAESLVHCALLVAVLGALAALLELRRPGAGEVAA